MTDAIDSQGDEQSGLNPYAPPSEGAEVVPSPADAVPAKKSPFWKRAVLLSLALFTAWMGFAIAASIYELVTMPEDAYGMHRATFRYSYLQTLIVATVLGTVAVIAMRRIHRGQRYGYAIAAVILLALYVLPLL